MLVREMLSLPSFEGSDVIAGAGNLDNEISSAMILEGPDIQNWGRRGQLIISSYYALEHLGESGLMRFFHTMSTIGIGAFAFKPGRVVEELPPQIIGLCEDFELPLIVLNPEVKYEAILSDVLGHILDSNLTLLNRFYEGHRRIMMLALKQPSISYILSTLKNSLRFDTTYLDTSRDRRLGTNAKLTEFTRYALTRRGPSPYQTHAYYDARLFYEQEGASPSGGESPVEAPPRHAIAIRIPSSDAVDHYLIIHSDDEELSQVDSMLVENIVSLLQIEILKQNAVKQKLFYQNNNTVHDLLLGRFTTHERVDGALAMLNINRFPLYEELLIRFELTDPSDSDRQPEVHQAVRRRLRSLYPDIVWYINADRLVILHNFRGEHSGIDVDEVRRGLSTLYNSSILPPFHYFAVLSTTTDRYGLPHINDEVMSVYRLYDTSNVRDQVIRYEDLGIYKLLLAAPDPTQLEQYIDPRVLRMSNENPELLHTLQALCENNLNYPKTAEQLYVHPKTVRYRVERARKAYGIDVKDSNDYLQVVISNKIIQLKQSE